MFVLTTWLLISLVLVVNSSGVLNDKEGPGTTMFNRLQGNAMDDCAYGLNSLRFDTTGAASQALDAFGKPEAGLLVNNREWLGHFSECSNLKDFKYCLLNINATAEIALIRYKNIDHIIWGVCVPRQCSYEDLHYNLQILVDLSTYSLHGFYVNNIYEDMWCLEDPIAPYGLGYYITVILFFVIGTLMTTGTILDKVERKYLANDQETDQSMEFAPLLEDQTEANLAGSVESSAYDCKRLFRRTALNQFEFAEWKHNFLFQTLVLNFFYAVDSFFFLSGLLVCFTTLHKLEGTNGRCKWRWFYLHRFIRLSPLMVVTTMIFMYISPHFIRGPNAQVYTKTENCDKYWWTNVIYINNIYPWDFYNTCLPWTWYLASDMQFFIISPLIIISFRSSIEYANVIYRMPYTRIPPYLVGMALGCILFKQKGETATIPKPFLLGGWFVASAVAAALLCGTITFSPSESSYNDNLKANSLGNSIFIADRHISVLGSIVYEMLSRFAWGLVLCWIVVACQFGGPGWVNDILSWSFWEPLSRINYNAYLLHVIISFIFYGNFGTSVYVSRVLMTFYFCGTVLLSYICAMVLALAVEIPISNIEKRYMPRLT